MEFRLLGPVEVRWRGRPVPLGGRRPRTLLATLLVDHGRVVPAANLIDAVWGPRPPSTARGVIQTYVSGLRRALTPPGGGTPIVTRQPGYLLRVESAAVDRDVFERQVERRRATTAATAATA